MALSCIEKTQRQLSLWSVSCTIILGDSSNFTMAALDFLVSEKQKSMRTRHREHVNVDVDLRLKLCTSGGWTRGLNSEGGESLNQPYVNAKKGA